MAQDVDVPGIGRTKSIYLVAPATLAGGYVLYRWWKNRSAANTAPAVVDPNNPAGMPNIGATSQLAGASTDSTLSAIIPPAPLTTNAEWTQAAVQYMSGIGFDPVATSNALGIYLDRQPLTSDQQTIVRTAIGVEGPPPEGGPYSILSALGNQTPPPPAPAELHPSWGPAIVPLPVWMAPPRIFNGQLFRPAQLR